MEKCEEGQFSDTNENNFRCIMCKPNTRKDETIFHTIIKEKELNKLNLNEYEDDDEDNDDDVQLDYVNFEYLYDKKDTIYHNIHVRDINREKCLTNYLLYKTLVLLKLYVLREALLPKIVSKCNRIEGNRKSKRPKNPNDEESEDNSDKENKSKFVNSARPKNETREEKKARKKAVKEERAEKRKTKLKKRKKKQIINSTRKR